MLRVKNFIPAISVEGFEDGTDFRRGRGTFAAVERAMGIPREKGLPLGISCCYTSKNVETIGSEEYFDQMIEWGARFCWLFTYMPFCLPPRLSGTFRRPRPGSGPATPRVRYVFAASELEAEPVAPAPCGRIGRVGSARISPKELA